MDVASAGADSSPQQQMTEQQIEALRMMQQGPQGGQGGPPPSGGMPQMMQSDCMMMAQPSGAPMAPYFVPPHLQQHYMPQTPMGQPSVHTQATKARLQCHACSKLLEYDAGAQYVQCFSCSTMNAVQQKTQVGGRVLSMLCAMCSTTNLAPYGINYVRCGTCHTISQVSHAYRVELQPQVAAGPTAQQGPAGGMTHMPSGGQSTQPGVRGGYGDMSAANNGGMQPSEVQSQNVPHETFN